MANNKLRDALGKIQWCLEWMFNNTDDKSVQNHLIEPIALAKAALAEPVRNCEVGTAEEQSRRFREYCGCRCLTKCKVYEKGIKLCIVNKNNYYKTDCRLVWSQLPYKKGGNK